MQKGLCLKLNLSYHNISYLTDENIPFSIKKTQITTDTFSCLLSSLLIHFLFNHKRRFLA